MDGLIFLSFVVAVVMGVAFVAFALKLLDVQEQRSAQEDRTRAPEDVPASAIAANVPAFFGVSHASRLPPAKQGFTERLPMLHEIKQQHIVWALDQAHGDRAYAAGLLGMTRRDFALLVARHCGDSATAQYRVESPSRPWVPSMREREAIDDRLFAFIQNHIRAEQAVVSEFIHLPSIDTLYRQARL